MKVVVIPADSDPVEPIAWAEIDNTLEGVQAAVGGYVQQLRYPSGVADGVLVLMNEEGKQMGLPMNSRATVMLKRHLGLMPGDFIVGPLLLVGENGAEWADAPAWLSEYFGLADTASATPNENFPFPEKPWPEQS